MTAIVLTIVFGILIVGSILMARQGKVPAVKKLPALDMIGKAVARAVEMGRPVHFTLGPNVDYSAGQAAGTLAGLNALEYVARTTARLKAKLFVTIGKAVMRPAIDETISSAYLAEGALQDYNRDSMLIYISEDFSAYNGAIGGIFMRERPAANIVGANATGSAAEVLTGTGAAAGCMQIGLSTCYSEDVFYILGMDYSTIGDEVYALGAYLSKDRLLLGSLRGQDFIKVISIVLLVALAITVAAGNTWLLTIFKQ